LHRYDDGHVKHPGHLSTTPLDWSPNRQRSILCEDKRPGEVTSDGVALLEGAGGNPHSSQFAIWSGERSRVFAAQSKGSVYPPVQVAGRAARSTLK